jgi:integrase
MAVSDTWHRRDGSRTKQYGKGKRYRVRWHEHDRFFDSKGAAERYWYKIRSEVPKKAADITIGDLVDRWLAGKQGLADSAGPDKPMILLMGTTGLRIGEACNLRVGDVDRRRRRLWVASATAKSRKGREVGIPASVIQLLPLAGRKRTEYVFTSRSGERVDEHNWRSRHFAQAVEKAVLGELHPHDLRHTAVSLAIRSGADVKVVQRVAGHSSAKLTLDTYGHLWDQGIDDVARRMEDLVGGGEDS